MKSSTLLVLMVTVGVQTSVAAQAPAWPGWRGPERDGSVPGFNVPAQWPDNLEVKWKQTVGEGHSSPVAGEGRVYLHTRQGEQEVVRCLDLASGELHWQKSYAAPYEMNPAARKHGKGPKSTPALAGNRLVTFGISGILSCWAADSGELLWQKDFQGEFEETSPSFGTATSPLIDGGRCIVYVGGTKAGALRAFDLETGTTEWSRDGEGPAYTTPIIAEFDSVRQVITQSRTHCLALSAETGELLWQIRFTTPYDQNIVTPVVFEDTVIFSGHHAKTVAYQIQHDSEWSPKPLWEKKNPTMYMSSPVLKENLMFGFAEQNQGQFFCLDVATGEVQWTGEGRTADNALLLRADDAVLALTTAGNFHVFRATPKQFDPLAHYTLADSAVWAQPAVIGNTLLIKDTTTLSAWEIAAEE